MGNVLLLYGKQYIDIQNAKVTIKYFTHPKINLFLCNLDHSKDTAPDYPRTWRRSRVYDAKKIPANSYIFDRSKYSKKLESDVALRYTMHKTMAHKKLHKIPIYINSFHLNVYCTLCTANTIRCWSLHLDVNLMANSFTDLHIQETPQNLKNWRGLKR